MGEIRVRHDRLHRSGDGQFNTVWAYRCSEHSCDKCFADNFFGPLSPNLLPGDQIRIIELEDKKSKLEYIGDSKVKAIVDTVVMSVDKQNKKVLVHPLGNATRFDNFWEKYGKPDKEGPVERPAEYISKTGTIKWNPGKKKHMVYDGDKLVGEFEDKEAAEKVAYGQKPVKEAINAE